MGVVLAVALIVLAAFWGLRRACPEGFMPGDYAIWQPKLGMIQRCALAPTVILGDSRAVAGIQPAMLPGSVNLALTGAGPIEAYYQLSDIVGHCRSRPHRLVVSFIPNHFINDKLFWSNAATFGLLDRAQLDEIRRTSLRLHDPLLFAQPDPFDLDGRAAAVLYGWRFPTSYAASLVEGGLLRRYPANRRLERETLLGSGFHLLGTADRFDVVSHESDVARFSPSRLILWYFERLLTLAQASGMTVIMVNAPTNPATHAALAPALIEGYTRALARMQQAHPGLRVLDPAIPVYPAELFGDADLHLNRNGARKFSAFLRDALDRR